MGEGLKDKRTHGGDRFSLDQEIIDLSVNINPLGVRSEIRDAILDSLSEIDRYPDIESRALKEAVSLREGVSPDQVICGNGASELIFDLAGTIRAKTVLIPAPSFTEYHRAVKSAGGETEYYYLKEETGFETDAGILKMIEPGIGLVILCNPNNPTGRLISYGLLLEILNKCRDNDIILFVDECFLDFAENGVSLSPLISSFENLIILKSCTKIYSIPGLRLGYALSGNRELLRKTEEGRCPWNISVTAEKAGIAALAINDHISETRKVIKEERTRLLNALDLLKGEGVSYIRPDANFILFKAENPPELCKELLKRGVMIRDCSDFPGLNNRWYRTAVGRKKENEALIRALKDIFNG